MSDVGHVLAVTLCIALISVINRSFFFLSRRDLRMPGALTRGLRHAPLAALLAVVAPEIALTHGELVASPRDARLWAALAAAAYAVVRREMLGTIALGMAVFWGFRFGLGW
jgi:branched-subunit amino acid transport protein